MIVKAIDLRCSAHNLVAHHKPPLLPEGPLSFVAEKTRIDNVRGSDDTGGNSRNGLLRSPSLPRGYLLDGGVPCV